MIVEICSTGTEVSAKQCRVRREDGRYVEMPHSGDDQTDARKPLVKMCTDVGLTTVARQCLAKLSRNTISY